MIWKRELFKSVLDGKTMLTEREQGGQIAQKEEEKMKTWEKQTI